MGYLDFFICIGNDRDTNIDGHVDKDTHIDIQIQLPIAVEQKRKKSSFINNNVIINVCQ